MVATSKAKALEAEASGPRKDLIAAMDVNNTSKEKIQALTEKLNAERLLVKQKDEQIVAANQKNEECYCQGRPCLSTYGQVQRCFVWLVF